MINYLRYYLLKFFAALNFHRSSSAFSLALAYGLLFGTLPYRGPLLVWILLALACFIPMHHLLMFFIAVFCWFLEPLLRDLQLFLGRILLESPLLFGLFRLIDNLPVFSWMGLLYADTLGGLLLGLGLGTLIFFISKYLLYPLLICCKQPLHRLRSCSHLLYKNLEGHIPEFSKLFKKNTKFQQWQQEYKQTREALQFAELTQEQIKLQEQRQPDFY